MKEFLSNNGIEFEFIDITDSMRNLKIYLKLRDTRSEFEEIKKIGRVGLPFIMIGNGEKLLFEQSEFDELVSLR